MTRSWAHPPTVLSSAAQEHREPFGLGLRSWTLRKPHPVHNSSRKLAHHLDTIHRNLRHKLLHRIFHLLLNNTLLKPVLGKHEKRLLHFLWNSCGLLGDPLLDAVLEHEFRHSRRLLLQQRQRNTESTSRRRNRHFQLDHLKKDVFANNLFLVNFTANLMLMNRELRNACILLPYSERTVYPFNQLSQAKTRNSKLVT